MSDLKSLVETAEVKEIHRVVQNGNEKFLCFTRTSATWMLCTTNGTDMWKVEIDEDELESYRDLAGVTTVEVFLSKFR